MLTNETKTEIKTLFPNHRVVFNENPFDGRFSVIVGDKSNNAAFNFELKRWKMIRKPDAKYFFFKVINRMISMLNNQMINVRVFGRLP